jgi:hypothetical protein
MRALPLQRILLASALILVLLPSATFLLAQATATAQIAGLVTDPTGAVVPEAQVKATQTDTGLTRTAVTGPEGGYVLPNLPVGPYELQVAASGFKTYVQKGMLLQVNTNVSLNVALEVGAVTEHVEVSANAMMVQLQASSISQVIERARVEDLPLNGRDPVQLVLISGAAVVGPPGDLKSSKNYPSSQAISVAGGQQNGTYYTLDGAGHNDPYGNINLPLPFPDVVQEFSALTSTIPAQYGGHAGAVVNVVTKSGTNKLHGSLFEFLRNGATNARNTFAARRDTLNRNQFGGAVGGPILKDKLFFFAGYQGTRVRTAPPTSTFYVPTAAVLAGDFSTMASSACGTARTIKDPTTGQPFSPTNTIPPARFNSEALALVNKYIPTTTDPCGKILVAIPNPSGEDQGIGRLDWTRSERHNIFGRYFIADFRNPPVFDGKNLLQTGRPGVSDRVQSVVLGDTYSLSPNVMNSLHLAYTRNVVVRGGAANLPSAQDLGLNIASYKDNSPLLTVSGYFTSNCGTCARAELPSNVFQVADDVTWIRGRHQITFGARWVRRQNNRYVTTGEPGQYSFDGSLTGVALADYLLGLPNSLYQGAINVYFARETVFGAYGEETFHPTPRVTVIVGVRWQPYFPVQDISDRATHFDWAALSANQRSTVFVNAPAGVLFPGGDVLPGGGLVPAAGTHNHLSSFEPRVGLAWDPTGTGRWSVRSSYGVFYDLPALSRSDRFGVSPPWGSFIKVNAPVGGFTNPYQDFPGGNPFPLPFIPTSDAFFPPGGQFVNLPLNIQPPYTQQWNLSIQRQVGSDWLFSASFVGNKSTHRWANVQRDPAVYIPGTCGTTPCSTIANTNSRRVVTRVNAAAGVLIDSLVEADDGGNASYNGLFLSVNHRLSRNFSVLANHTWSHCISGVALWSELSGGIYQNPYDREGDRGNCNVDIRHNTNVSFLATSPQFSGPIKRRLLGSWRLGGIITKRSGLWFSPLTGTDASRTGVGADRPNVVRDPKLSNPTAALWFDKTAFRANAPGTYGNAGAYSLVGPGALTFDAMLTRAFGIREGQRLEVRAEAFNVLNHPNYGDPTNSLSSANFGRILSAADPRIWQFALKYIF